MKSLAIALAAVVISTAAQAQTTPTMTCRQVQATIAARGGVVLYTGQYTYDRYVADRRFCTSTQVTRQQYVPSRDTRYCPVNICIDPDMDLDRFDR